MTAGERVANELNSMKKFGLGSPKRCASDMGLLEQINWDASDALSATHDHEQRYPVAFKDGSGCWIIDEEAATFVVEDALSESVADTMAQKAMSVLSRHGLEIEPDAVNALPGYNKSGMNRRGVIWFEDDSVATYRFDTEAWEAR